MSARLCIVEDDPTIRELVQDRLVREGFEVDSFDHASPVLQSQSAWDLYILDILLKGKPSGLEICEHVRKHFSTVPILILSALSEPSDRISGLKRGADDYLTKPFEMEELVLRVKGMLKRRVWYGQMPQDEEAFRWGKNEINFKSFKAKSGNQSFELSQKETMLMKLFVERKGEVVPREDILNFVWGYDVFPSTRTVDNFIVRLRKYFEEEPSRPVYLHSVRGVGYKFTPEGENK